MSTFVIVPGAWDTPATVGPMVEPLESAGHAVIGRHFNGVEASERDAVRSYLERTLADSRRQPSGPPCLVLEIGPLAAVLSLAVGHREPVVGRAAEADGHRFPRPGVPRRDRGLFPVRRHDPHGR